MNHTLLMVPAQTSFGKSFWQADSLFQRDVARLQLRPTSDSSTTNAFDPLASGSSRVCAGVATENSASLHYDHISDCIRRHPAQPVFASVFENQSNRLGQILSTLFDRAPLPVSARYLWTVADKPLPVLLDNHSKFVTHTTLPPMKNNLN